MTPVAGTTEVYISKKLTDGIGVLKISLCRNRDAVSCFLRGSGKHNLVKAASREARGKGVMVAMKDQISPDFGVNKANMTNSELNVKDTKNLPRGRQLHDAK